jgi:hypothetical protein
MATSVVPAEFSVKQIEERGGQAEPPNADRPNEEEMRLPSLW